MLFNNFYILDYNCYFKKTLKIKNKIRDLLIIERILKSFFLRIIRLLNLIRNLQNVDLFIYPK